MMHNKKVKSNKAIIANAAVLLLNLNPN